MDGFQQDIMLARMLRPLAKAGRQGDLIALYDLLEHNAKEKNAEECAKVRQLIIKQQKFITMNSPLLQVQSESIRAGKSAGMRIAERMIKLLGLKPGPEPGPEETGPDET